MTSPGKLRTQRVGTGQAGGTLPEAQALPPMLLGNDVGLRPLGKQPGLHAMPHLGPRRDSGHDVGQGHQALLPGLHRLTQGRTRTAGSRSAAARRHAGRRAHTRQPGDSPRATSAIGAAASRARGSGSAAGIAVPYRHQRVCAYQSQAGPERSNSSPGSPWLPGSASPPVPTRRASRPAGRPRAAQRSAAKPVLVLGASSAMHSEKHRCEAAPSLGRARVL